MDKLEDTPHGLAACPFCGELEDLAVSGGYVGCGNCGAMAGSMYKQDLMAVQIWNTRAEPDIAEMQERVKGLEQFAMWCIGMAKQHGGDQYCRIAAEAVGLLRQQEG